MTKRIATPVLLILFAIAAAYAASCHCADPTPPPAKLGEGSPDTPLPPSGERGLGVRGSALTTATATTDGDFLSGNYGYGQAENISISAGAVRRTSGVFAFGLPNVGPETFFGWQQTNFSGKRYGHATAIHNGYLYILGGFDGSLRLDDAYVGVLNADGTIRYHLGLGPIPGARHDHAAVVHNNFLYIVGGFGNSGFLDDVRFAKINDDGTLGTWSAAPSLPAGAARAGHTAAVYNGWLYVVGGNGSQYFNNILKARMNPDGTLGTWSAAGSFTTGRLWHGSGINMGWLYVLGGQDSGANLLSDVQFAQIGPDGNVGVFTSTLSLSGGLSGFGCVATGNNIFVVGGNKSPGGQSADLQIASLNSSSGAVSSWTTASDAALPSARYGLSAVFYNYYLYAVAGHDDTTALDTIASIPTFGTSTGSAWRASSTLTTARANHAGVMNGETLYLLGGATTSGGPLNEARHAGINSIGGVQTWVVDATPQWSARHGHGAVVYNNHIYVAGGRDDTPAYFKDVWHAPINSDATVGQWIQAVNDLDTTGRALHGMAAVGGYLYIFGGFDGTNHLDTVRFTQLDAAGEPGAWAATTSLPVQAAIAARSGMGVAVRGEDIYLTGGRFGAGAGSVRNNVVYGRINAATGQITTWNIAGPVLASGIEGAGSVILNDRLYVLGGYDGTNYSDDIQYSLINTDGSLFGWSLAQAPMSSAKRWFTANVYNGFLFVTGGETIVAKLGTVETTTFNADGTAGGWKSSTALPAGRFGGCAVANAGFAYMTGGRLDSNPNTYANDAWYAPLNADGSVGTWSSALPFANGRNRHQCAVGNGYLYVLGGQGQSADLTDVLAAKFKTDGSGALEPWFSAGTLPAPRTDAAAVAYNGYLYVVGPDVRSAPINPSDGTLGSWTTLSQYTDPRTGHGAFVYNGYLYVLGGRNLSSVYKNDVQYARLHADGTLGPWNLTMQFTTPRDRFGLGVYNGYVFIFGGYDWNGVPLSDVMSAPMNLDGSLGSWAAAASILPVARADEASFAYNHFIYALGAYVGGNGSVETYYAPIVVQPTYPTGRYSKLFDLGVDATVNYIYLDGTVVDERGFTVQYRTATNGGTFSAWSASQAVDNDPGTVNVGLTARYVEVLLTIYGLGSQRASSELAQLSIDTNPLPNGANCQLSGDCQSTFCVGGVCCAVACNQPGECNEAGTCGGGQCTYPPKGAGTQCTDTTPNDCYRAACNGGGLCEQQQGIHGQGFVCRTVQSGDVCDLEDICNGTSPACDDTVFGINAKVCRPAGGECENDVYCDGTNKTCPTANSYKAGTPCTPDAFSCTDDICDPAGTGACVHTVLASYCLIGGQCVASGTPNPANSCEKCDPSQWAYGWVGRAGSCDDQDGCTKGDGCSIVQNLMCEQRGTTCQTDVDCPAGDHCKPFPGGRCEGQLYSCPSPTECQKEQKCDGNGGCTVTNKSLGEGCPADAFSCTSDYCDGNGACTHPISSGFCIINNACVASGTRNPSNACEACNPAVSTIRWSPSVGQACSDNQSCTKQDKCEAATGTIGKCSKTEQPCTGTSCPAGETCVFAGECRGTPYTCPTPQECEKAVICDGNGGCTVEPEPAGTACAPDELACTRDVCNGQGACSHPTEQGFCVIGSTPECFREGDRNPQNSCEVCKASDSDAWTTLKSLEPCDDRDPCTKDDKCQPDGRCKGVSDPTCSGKCGSDADCAAKPGPHCDQASGNCVACTLDAHCGAGKSCDSASNTCRDAAQCTKDLECAAKDPKRPVCGDAGTCVECRDDIGCRGLFSDRKICLQDTGSCVECTADDDCASGKTCDRSAFTCIPEATDGGPVTGDGGDAGKDGAAGCTSNTQCGGGTPICNVSSGDCVECMDSSTCVIGHGDRIYCSNTLHKCVECIVSQTCGGGKTCNTSTGTCVGGSTDDTGQPNEDAGQPAEDGGGTTPAGEDAGEAAAEGIKNPYGCMCATLTLQ